MEHTEKAVEVYQLRIWIRKICPQIWRRLLVRSDSTIAELHDTLQVAFGWADDHLHQFLIRGKPYGIGRVGGNIFDDNPRQVQLRDFHFRPKETWLYEYDLTDWWQHEIRLEQVLPFDPTKRYPICTAGKRRGPIENCGGPWAFMELQDKYPQWEVLPQFAQLLLDHRDDLETIPERGQTGRLLKRVSVPVYFCMAVLHLPSERFAPILEWSQRVLYRA
jgi:hypothetical protein